MLFTDSPTELTTGVTDALLAVECLAIRSFLRRAAYVDSWRVSLWSWVLGLMAFASLLGAVAHGLLLPGFAQAVLWRLLYLSLGVLVAIVPVAAVYDWQGHLAAARLIPCAIAAGIALLAATEIAKGEFIVFVVYDSLFMSAAAAIYLFLAATKRLKGALLVAGALLVNLAAGGVQASGLSIQGPVPLDHNGLFHLVQMAGTAMLGAGLAKGMRR